MNPAKWAAGHVIVSTDEQERRLSICAECDYARLNVSGYCNSCRKPFHKRIQTDDELACKCGGSIKTLGEFAQCGHCGCPLASRTKFKLSHCPIGKW